MKCEKIECELCSSISNLFYFSLIMDELPPNIICKECIYKIKMNKTQELFLEYSVIETK